MVAANWSTALWGPAASVANAFLLVGLDLATRDVLHDAWRGGGRWALPRNMALLIAAGGLLSWLLNRGAGRIALASLTAFILSGVADALMYQRLQGASYAVRANGSNVTAALVDSLVFPLLAFGVFLPLVTLGQWAAKAGGGALWAWALARWQKGWAK